MPIMSYVNALEFSECCCEEVMFLLTLSVVLKSRHFSPPPTLTPTHKLVDFHDMHVIPAAEIECFRQVGRSNVFRF